MRHFYGSHFLLIELTGAVAVSCFVAAWGEAGGGWQTIAPLLQDNRAAIYSACASVAGSLLGFVIAALAIVLSSAGSRRLDPVRSADRLQTLFRVLTAATVVLGLATVVALTALLLDRDNLQRPLLAYLCFGTVLSSIVTLARTVWILESVVAIVAAPSKKRSGEE
jgi:hypothetical protein